MASFENNQKKSKESNGRGGVRPGAGRKAGSATKKTREIADRAASEGITPLEFMLRILRTEPTEEMDEAQKRFLLENRFEAAKAAAPYMHARLQSVVMDANVTHRSLDQELADLNAVGNAKSGS